VNTLRILYHLARADLLERARRHSFLIALGAMILFGYTIVRGDLYLELEGYRGAPDSAWVGGMMAASAILMLSLFGFYLVKNAIARDVQTGVGQIIASSPVSRPLYLLGKWLSNWAVLAALVGILAVAALAMQLYVRGAGELDPVTLISPFVLLALPAMAVVAALAVFFESISWLRGSLGNVVYFFLWPFALTAALVTSHHWLDWSGLGILARSMGAALTDVYCDYNGGFSFGVGVLPEGALQTFFWPGLEWTTEVVLSRVVWLAGTVTLALAGGAFFRQFDPSWERAAGTLGSKEPIAVKDAPAEAAVLPLPAYCGATLPADSVRFGFVQAIVAEWRIVTKGLRWWCYLAAAIVIVGGLVSPAEVSRKWWLLAAWLWPVFIWSSLGTREARHRTNALVFSSPHPLLRQLPAAWLSGFMLTVVVGSGVGLNLLHVGDWAALAAWVAGALFIPSLALALGVWSSTGRLFEVVYLLLWYMGPLHPTDLPYLDFMGASDVSVEAGVWKVFVLAGLLLVGGAAVGRWRQLRH
jgi:hypothetical protein